ncbi:hypothetical protein [Actinocorallia libanotica]|uniref:Tyr recombinase domain-containing protein n=1 Tax=Actinocorallia libanotica TaxID=46162 RepID=A0ABP4CCR4_9ACTN
MADKSGAAIETYAPAGDPPGWPRVAGQVRATVALAAPAVPYAEDELMGVMAKLALFADAEGYPLEAASWLSREYIERFVLVGCAHLGEATRANYRSKLLRLREAVLGGDCATGTPARLSGSAASRPYSRAEQAALWAWAAGQPTEELRCGLRVLMALGLGCGLDSRDVLPLRARDVRATDGVVVAVRGRRARMVVCRRPWERILAAEAARVEPERYLLRPQVANRGGNLVTNFVSRAHPAPDTPALKTTRLRATWLVALINAGLPLPVIVAAAGLQTLHGLSRILTHVHNVGPEVAATLLRGQE